MCSYIAVIDRSKCISFWDPRMVVDQQGYPAYWPSCTTQSTRSVLEPAQPLRAQASHYHIYFHRTTVAKRKSWVLGALLLPLGALNRKQNHAHPLSGE